MQRKRGDIFRIKSPPQLAGLLGQLVKESPVTGALTLELLESRNAYKKGERVLISAGDWEYYKAANSFQKL